MKIDGEENRRREDRKGDRRKGEKTRGRGGEQRNTRILEQEKDILVSGRVGMPSPITKAPQTHTRS